MDETRYTHFSKLWNGLNNYLNQGGPINIELGILTGRGKELGELVKLEQNRWD